jgi:2'-5' RNA ligase
MRLFVGIALSAEARQELERLMLRLRGKDDGLRWSAAAQWHITLVFVGEAEQETQRRLAGELRRICLGAVPVEIDGLGMFERVGILHAAVEVTPELRRLQRAVAAAAETCGIEVEERAYRPHITLARSRNREGRRTLERMRGRLEQQRLRARWSADEFLLYESELSPEGSRYRVQERFALTERRAGLE